jgi:5-methylcytosine-specific restriction endonuclease McrA
MAFATNPKPEPHDRVKARRRRQFDAARARVREAQWEKDGRCCVRCGKPVVLKLAQGDWWNVANINEKRPRSLGGSALDLANTETLCTGCHTGRGRHVA